MSLRKEVFVSIQSQSNCDRDKYVRRIRVNQSNQALPRVNSHELLGVKGVLAIDHNSECYVLRLTRSGKLILTK